MHSAFEDPVRVLPDGRGLWVYPLLFGEARLGIGQLDSVAMDDVW